MNDFPVQTCGRYYAQYLHIENENQQVKSFSITHICDTACRPVQNDARCLKNSARTERIHRDFDLLGEVATVSWQASMQISRT